MSFAWPHLLWFLLVPAALLALELRRHRRSASDRHPKVLRAEAGAASLSLRPGPAETVPGRRPRAWLCAGLALGIAALARPQWGQADEPVFGQSREILLAVDLSRSMLTPDVPPTRLERAKLLAQSLLPRLSGERIGLEVFAGTAFLESPLSSDYDILNEFLPALRPGFMPVGGTDYGAMIDVAAGAFSRQPNTDRYLVVLSDGGATDDDWRKHIAALQEKGIRVVGLGIGTAAGGFIPDGQGGLMKDERGAVVLSKLESGTLRELAQKTGGLYRDAGAWLDLDRVLQATVELGRKGRFLEHRGVLKIDRFQWLLAPALICLLVGFWREFPARPRPREIKFGGKKGAAAAGRIGLFLAFLALAARGRAQDAAAPPREDPAKPLARIVGRLSSQDSAGPLDWSELARDTIDWGRQLRQDGGKVPPGPVGDALAAVAAGAAEDARAADWPRLRAELRELLRPPEEKPKPPPPPQNQSTKNQSNPNQPSQNQGGSGQNSAPPQPQNPSQSQASSAPRPNPPPASPRPPPEGDSQTIGGAVQPRREDAAAADPAVAPLVAKLDQLRGQDSPAELQQMIQNSLPKPPAKNEKDW